MAGDERSRWIFRVLILLVVCTRPGTGSTVTITHNDEMHGVLTSPGYPGPYGNDLDIRWLIAVPRGFSVRLYMTEFDVEPGIDGCDQDYVTVSADNETVGEFCGRAGTPNAPGNQTMTSPSNSMEVQFRSDYSNEHRYTGFMAHFVAEDIDECAEEAAGPCDHFCHNYLGGYYCSCEIGYTLHQDGTSCEVLCSGNILESASGVITSPGYPYSYPRRSECDWLIRAEAGYVISLTFEDFDLEAHPDVKCPYDALRIKQDNQQLGPFCGRDRADWPEEIQANKLIKIYFVSDESGENRGFRARFSSAGKPCVDIDAPDNGLLFLFNVTVGNIATFSCDDGYVLVGPEHRTCLPSGEWSGNASICQVVKCDPPINIDNGEVVVSDESLVYRTVAVYSCDPLYELQGPEARVCDLDGMWNEEEPACIPVCGVSSIVPRKAPRRRIVGGREARRSSWPWAARLIIEAPNFGIRNRLCGGSLISESWVLTAAHCVTIRSREELFGQQLPAETVTVTLGIHNASDRNVEVRQVTQIVRAPSYDAALFDADVALLRLARPVTLSTTIRPICVPDEETFGGGDDYSVDPGIFDEEAVTIGWGSTGQESRSNVLKEVYIPIVDQETCEEAMQTTITEHMVCAGASVGGRDSCFGDSGGALMLKEDDTNRYYAFGLVSWGDQTCAKQGRYGVYAKVGSVATWIRQVVHM